MSARIERKKEYPLLKEKAREDDMVSMTSEISKMSFQLERHNIDQIMSVKRKIIGYKTRIASEKINKDELFKNMTIDIYYKVINTNLDSIYIPIKIYLEG